MNFKCGILLSFQIMTIAMQNYVFDMKTPSVSVLWPHIHDTLIFLELNLTCLLPLTKQQQQIQLSAKIQRTGNPSFG